MSFPKCVGSLLFLAILALASPSFAQTNTLPVISASEATNYINQQVVVIDTVAQVAIRSNIWLLHLNQKFPKSPLNAVVRKSATNNFPNFADYFGQRVEITGRIVEYRGRLELPLLTTNQIKILAPPEKSPALAVAIAQTQAPPAPAPAMAPVQAAPVVTVPSISPMSLVTPAAEDHSGRTLKWILALLAVISVLMAMGIFIVWRRPKDLAPIPPPTALAKLPDTSSPDVSAEAWKQRALTAEAMAGQQGQMLREKIMPELTEFAKQSLVQGLYAQRNALLETQRRAQESLAELESRLSTIQAPLNDRIRAYEKRIAELEREVETQGDEMRELTRATLTLVRRKLEDERRGAPLHSRFN